jgi:hypothetical protein
MYKVLIFVCGEEVNILKINTEDLLDASEDSGLEVNAKKTECMLSVTVLLNHDMVLLPQWLPTFWRNITPPY